MSKVSNAASWVMWRLVAHSAHGYSQPNHHGTGGPSTAIEDRLDVGGGK